MAIDLKTASLAEMKQYARDELGLSIPRGAEEETIRKLIADADDSSAQPPKPAKVGDVIPKRRMIKINIMKTDRDGGDRDVPVGVNGKLYLIQRGVDVEVPAEVVEVLRNAVETRWEQRKDPENPLRSQMIRRDTHAYPFSIVP